MPVSSHCFAWVATTADSRAKSPATKRIASTVWPLAMVSVLAPSSASRCQVRLRRPRQDALAHQADMDRHHLADIAGLDQFLHVHHGGIDAGLQADRGDEPLGLGQRRQFHGLRRRPPERPFAIDVLAGLQRRLGRRVVRRHAHDDGDRVDLRRGDHLAVVVEGQPRAVGLARRLGAVGPGGADRGQLDIRAGLHRRQVRARRPGAPDAGADQAQPNLVCHSVASPGASLSITNLVGRAETPPSRACRSSRRRGFPACRPIPCSSPDG